MRRAIIHMRFGTTLLPRIEESDDQTHHHTVEIDIGDNEEVKELELVKLGPAYQQRMQTDEEAEQSRELWEDGQIIGRELSSSFTPSPRPSGPRRINERIKGVDRYRYRLVTLEQVEEVVDAHVIEEGHKDEYVIGPGTLD